MIVYNYTKNDSIETHLVHGNWQEHIHTCENLRDEDENVIFREAASDKAY
jgi:hypothetical protein